MGTCCIYAVRMPVAPASSLTQDPKLDRERDPVQSLKQPPAAERVYAHVKQGVLDRRYEGGTLLTEGELAEAVGVSRTPVREALLKLEVEGLLRLYPKKGALVLPVSAQEIADVVETRLLVETHSVRKAVPAPPALLARLEELLRTQREQAAAGDFSAAAVTDRCFHAEIVRSGGNEILARLYDQLRDRQLRMGVAVMHSHPDRIAKTLAEHEELLGALKSGDAAAAEAVVTRHVGWFQNLARGEVR
nr:GntR family transcriptional regulator [Streptomyces longisporoflavus]